jgi:hypothetical protein
MSTRKKSSKTVKSQVADHAAGRTTQGPRPSTLRKRIDGWRDTLSEQINEHPGRTVAVALGTGYLLAGGLFSRLTARLVGLGMRMGLRVGGAPLVTQGLVALREGLRSRADGRSAARGDRRPSPPGHTWHAPVTRSSAPPR